MSRNTRLEDLAKLAGVSISTASRALNDSPAVNARTKQLIWKLAREHDYPFRRYMPAGPIGAEGVIALVTPRPQGREGRLSDPFFLELLAGVGEAAWTGDDTRPDAARFYSNRRAHLAGEPDFGRLMSAIAREPRGLRPA